MPVISGVKTTKVPLSVLGAVCFITAFMCQTRFKITKEIKPEVTPPLLKSNYVSMIYGFGKPDRFRLVLRTLIGVTSPLVSLMSTVLLMIGTTKSNPYYFLPWFFVTLKGLIFTQSENLTGILRELYHRYDQTYTFCLEDCKWSCLYLTLLFFIIAECFALYEIFEICKSVWNSQQDNVVEERMKIEPSDFDSNHSVHSMRTVSSLSLKLDQHHTVTSIYKFGLLSDERTNESLSSLKSLIALFRKK